MARSSWKHKYHNFYLIRRLERRLRGKHFRRPVLITRNKATLFSRFFLKKLSQLDFLVRVYTGKLFVVLKLDMLVANTRLGEYVFTKWRTRRIHSAAAARAGKKSGKRGVQKIQQAPVRRGPIWSLRIKKKLKKQRDGHDR